MKRKLVPAIAAGLVLAVAMGLGAQNGNSVKQTYTGPVNESIGPFQLILERGASVETDYDPSATRVLIRTVAQEARLTTSARYLLLITNEEGTVEVTLPSGRVVKIEPGRADILGRSLVDDPGTISIRIASTASLTVLEGVPAAALTGQVTTASPVNPVTGPRPETTIAVSPSTLTGPRGFGTSGQP